MKILKGLDVLGGTISHIDSHHSLHTHPLCQKVYLKLAQKYNVPVRGGEGLGQLSVSGKNIKSTVFYTADWTGTGLPLSSLKTNILNSIELANGGVLELVTHPGFSDEGLKRVSSLHDMRHHDYQCLIKLAEENWLEKQGIRLTSFQHI